MGGKKEGRAKKKKGKLILEGRDYSVREEKKKE